MHSCLIKVLLRIADETAEIGCKLSLQRFSALPGSGKLLSDGIIYDKIIE